jgi:hypothetical protein
MCWLATDAYEGPWGVAVYSLEDATIYLLVVEPLILILLAGEEPAKLPVELPIELLIEPST